MPLAVVWGAKDEVIPVRHAEIVERVAPGARVEIFADSGHFPHKDEPRRFVRTVRSFVRGTEPALHDRDRWRALLRGEGDVAAEAG
jgi:pimeloyl-ACP methyl ester carboxylesterase